MVLQSHHVYLNIEQEVIIRSDFIRIQEGIFFVRIHASSYSFYYIFVVPGANKITN